MSWRDANTPSDSIQLKNSLTIVPVIITLQLFCPCTFAQTPNRRNTFLLQVFVFLPESMVPTMFATATARSILQKSVRRMRHCEMPLHALLLIRPLGVLI